MSTAKLPKPHGTLHSRPPTPACLSAAVAALSGGNCATIPELPTLPLPNSSNCRGRTFTPREVLPSSRRVTMPPARRRAAAISAAAAAAAAAAAVCCGVSSAFPRGDVMFAAPGTTGAVPGGIAAPTACALAELQACDFAGQTLLPATAGFAAVTRIDNALVHVTPALVAAPRDAGSVPCVVHAARACGLPLAVQSGGHSAAGYGLAADGLVLSLRGFNATVSNTSTTDVGLATVGPLDEAVGVLTVGAGARFGEVYAAVQGTGWVPVGGGCPQVALAGFLQGGGWSFLSRSYGLGADTVVGADVVLANGSLVHVHATGDAGGGGGGAHTNGGDGDVSRELWWAIRGGGGGSFGVVTSFDIQLYRPAPQMLVGEVCWEPGGAAVAQLWQLWLDGWETMPRWLDVDPVWLPIGAGGAVQFCLTVVCNNASRGACAGAVAPFLAVPNRTVDTLQTQPFLDWQIANTNATSEDFFSQYLKSGVLLPGALTVPVALQLEAALLSAPSPKNLFLFHVGGGAIADVPANATAFVHRGAQVVLQIKGIWSDPADEAANVAWVEGVFAGVAHLLSGAYVNYIDAALPAWQQAYFGDNYPRLQRIKALVDPDNVFHFNQSVELPATAAVPPLPPPPPPPVDPRGVGDATAATSGPARVVVVGGGIGGGAFSYYARLFAEQGIGSVTANVTAFEQRTVLGGRLKHIVRDGVVLEQGGDAWASVNRYVAELVKTLNLTDSGANAAGAAIPGTGVAPAAAAAAAVAALLGAAGPRAAPESVWDQTEFVNLTALVEDNRASFVKLVELLAAFITQLELNYDERDSPAGGKTPRAFLDIPGFLKSGSLHTYTSVLSSDELTALSVAAEVQRAGVEPLIRVIYDQLLNGTHSFASLVSLTALINAYSVPSGNSRLVEALFEHGGADVHVATKVTRVVANPANSSGGGGGGGYTVWYEPAPAPDAAAAVVPESMQADYVVLAAPFEFLNISFEGFELPPALANQPRSWVKWHVLHVKAPSGVDPAFFGLPAAAELADDVLTTARVQQGQFPFTDVQLDDNSTGEAVFKIFSNEGLDDATLARLFRPPVVWVERQEWPYCFPRLHPVDDDSGFQPVRVHGDGSKTTMFNVNAMESVASAMEGSTIAGRNIALLLLQAL